jgi:hypothetical protein
VFHRQDTKVAKIRQLPNWVLAALGVLGDMAMKRAAY